MNLSILERMIREGDLSLDALRYLLQCKSESEWLDYKQDLALDRDKSVCDFTKDVLALKNVGGGYFVVGVRDKVWEPIGLAARLPYDAKMLRDKVRRGAGVEVDVDIVHHDLKQPVGGGLFALIFVRASRKRSKRRAPTVVAKDFCAKEHFGLRRGEIYVRNGDSTVLVRTQEELVRVLDNLEAQADQDALEVSSRPSPFAIQEGAYRLLDRGFENFIGRARLRQELIEAVTRDPRIWIINVHGPGGVGKSALVSWATYEFYRERRFEAIINLTAKDTVLTDAGIKPFSRTLYSLENLLDHILLTLDHPCDQDLEAKKVLATEILSAWSTLLVLDNMESLSDGRILNFVQGLPPGTKAKVLLTSRTRTGGWEYPLSVRELDEGEVEEFVVVKSHEMKLGLSLDRRVFDQIKKSSGGLPLAIQWILGRYKVSRDLDSVVGAVSEKDSPILEFSFRNVWNVLSPAAKAILAIMSIFDGAVTIQDIAIATEFPNENIEKAFGELEDVTLVTRVTQQSDGRVTYSALPITLAFAQHQLASMGDFEVACRRRYQKFSDQMELRESEVGRFRGLMERYGLESENEKRAAILCRRGESEMFTGNVGNAEVLFRQARELAPASAYVYAMGASYELARNRVGAALELVSEACRRATKRTGALCYTIKARVLDVQRDRVGRVQALAKALEFDPSDNVLRHQYGVALSWAGKTEQAIEEFTRIIDIERVKVPLRETLLMALKTRIINLRRLGQTAEAEADLAYAKEILAKHRHLQANAQHIADLEDEP
jgi:tetratricopeptide (TPR) repeat protein